MDWSKGMQQRFEYRIVSPDTWGDVAELEGVESAEITHDITLPTMGNAKIRIDGELGEVYVRAYLVATQDGETERHPLGTFMVQTPERKTDGTRQFTDATCYTPLRELAETYPPIGWTAPKNDRVERVVEQAILNFSRLAHDTSDDTEKLPEAYTADPQAKWLDVLRDLLARIGKRLTLDPMGRVGSDVVRDPAAMKPVKTFRQDDASVVYADVDDVRDFYDVPNVYEVVCSTAKGVQFAKAENTSADSEISTKARGRRVVYRDLQPQVSANPTKDELTFYAKTKLREMSAIEHKVELSTGYDPRVKAGSCVRLELDKPYVRANAIVQSMTITCGEGCKCDLVCTYTENLW